MSRTREHPARSLRDIAGGRWTLVVAAFALGWVGFLLVITRESSEPAIGEAAPAVALATVQGEPLPAPMPAGSEPPLQRSTGDDEARLVEEPPPPPPPVEAQPVPLPPATEPAAPSIPQAAQAPELLADQEAPRYPASSLRRGESGTVVLRVQVDAAGRAGDVEIIERSGSRALDRSAAEAALRWRFKPALDDSGQPVPGEAVVPVEFQPR